MKQILGILQNERIADLFAEYEARQSKESQLVKALDIMDTAVQHMCAKYLAYVGSFDNGFYWKLFFNDEFAKMFDFEPVLRRVLDEIRGRVSVRLKDELGIKNTCRISLAMYNNKEEINYLVKVLDNPNIKNEII